MARIDLYGDSSPDQNYPGGSSSFNESAYAQPAAPLPLPQPVAPARPEGGRDPNTGAYVPNQPIPGAPDTYWNGDQQLPIPHGSNPSGGNTTTSGGGATGGWDPAAAERAIRDQYQRLGNRPPSAQELATDLEAARRYGLTNPNGPTGGTLGQIAARFNNTPGSGVTGNPFAGWSNPNDPRTALSQPGGGLPGVPGGGFAGGANPPRSPGNYSGASYNAPGVNLPQTQFSDPYTKLLEEIAHNQLNSLQGNNPQTQQVMDFLNKQFAALSNSPGYTPDEMAVLNTQAFEPIEALRKASQQREFQRTSAAGYLPTSGLTLDQQRQIDTSSDQARTAANRDLAINAINRQGQNRQQALQYGMQALQLPQQQNAQALDVANTLYQLPRTAMLDAAGIVNASSPQSVITPYIQLMQQQQQQQLLQQNQQAAYAQSIGTWLSTLFGGGG